MIFSALALAAASTSGWLLTEKVDPMTDQKDASARVMNESGGRLSVFCSSALGRIVTIQLSAPQYYARSYTEGQMRFDGGPVVEMRFDLLKNVAYIGEDRSDLYKLAKYIATSKRTAFRIFDYNNQPVDLAFNVEGGEEHIRHVFEVCGYTDPLADAAKR